MSCIGLYDIDFWHCQHKHPNLELMKTYKFYYDKGDKVEFIKPKQDIGRFNHVIYFKENFNIKIPDDICVTGEKKSFYGFGFYGYLTELKPEIFVVPPSYLIYEPFAYKFPNNIYNSLKSNSYIRFENKDFSDLKAGGGTIYFADNNLFNSDGIEDFLLENKNKNFYCFNTPNVNIQEKDIFRFNELFKSNIIINNYSEDDFFNFIEEKNIIFNMEIIDGEDEYNYIIRLIKTILFLKKYNKKNFIKISPNKYDKLLRKWIAIQGKDSNLSCFNYYDGNKEVQNFINSQCTEIRLLLKQDPQKVTRENLSLKNNLIVK